MTIPNAAEYRTPVQRKAAEAVQMCKCHFCGADEGEECHVRPAGKPLKFPHQRRMRAYHHRCKSHTDGLDQRSPVGSAGPDRTEGRPVDATTNLDDNDACAVHLWMMRQPALDRLYEIMNRLTPPNLTTLEILALLTVLEPADQRVNAQTAPVLKLVRQGGHDE
jgi:hypothetical protein